MLESPLVGSQQQIRWGRTDGTWRREDLPVPARVAEGCARILGTNSHTDGTGWAHATRPERDTIAAWSSRDGTAWTL